jgi:hypothetical protein
MITNSSSISPNRRTALAEKTSWQTRQVLSLGRSNGWGFTVLGKADLPDRPIHLEKWLIVPAHEDSTPVPKRTLERIHAIYTAGLQPKGFVVVHETPRYLPAPRQEAPQNTNSFQARPGDHFGQAPYETKKKGDSSGSSSFASLATGLGTVLSAMALLIFPALLMGLLALDPIVIAVMDDGSWVEIDRWNV